jgi:hypothetical protein
VTVTFTTVDSQSRPCTIYAQVCLDGSSSCRTAAITGTLTGLTTSPDGVTHTFRWNARRDLGFHARTAVLQLIAYNAQTIGPTASVSLTVPYSENLHARLQQVNSYYIDYGTFDNARVATAKTYELVIMHPTQSRTTISRSLVASIQQGVDPLDPADDVIVLGYITIGEDDRTIGISASTFATDPRFRGDGTGPRIDPRGTLQRQMFFVARPDHLIGLETGLAGSGGSLSGVSQLGSPSNGGTGYASYYLDDNSVYLNNGRGDGIPDRNSAFGGCFVNAGDPGIAN